MRKAQYMSGWDWGPRLVSCGVWGAVELLEFAGRIESVSFLQERLESDRFRVWAEAETEGEGSLSFEVDGHTFGLGESVELEPNLWWPAGEGPQTLLLARATFGGHTVEKKIGLRTIRLLREKDEHGRSFEFEVNGRKICARGANWIPDDNFVTRTTRAASRTRRARTRLQHAPRLGRRAVRERGEFYDACDELGILVWQDFPYGCAYYPDSDAEVAVVRDEAADHVRRLRNHACLALWCGNNENQEMWLGKWGGKERPPTRYYGERPLRRDPAPGGRRASATGATTSARAPIGTSTRRGRRQSARTERRAVRRPALLGRLARARRLEATTTSRRPASPPSTASPPPRPSRSGAAALAPADPDLRSPVARWHDKTGKGSEIFIGYVELHYPASKTMEDWTYYSQLNQRDAMRHGVEHFRRSPFCRGSLIWQINDCWPVQSWAMEDYHRLLKPAGHEMARVYAATMLSLVVGDRAEAWVVHDGPEPLSDTLRVFACDTLSDDARQLGSCEVTLPPGGRARFFEPRSLGPRPFTNLSRRDPRQPPRRHPHRLPHRA